MATPSTNHLQLNFLDFNKVADAEYNRLRSGLYYKCIIYKYYKAGYKCIRCNEEHKLHYMSGGFPAYCFYCSAYQKDTSQMLKNEILWDLGMRQKIKNSREGALVRSQQNKSRYFSMFGAVDVVHTLKFRDEWQADEVLLKRVNGIGALYFVLVSFITSGNSIWDSYCNLCRKSHNLNSDYCHQPCGNWFKVSDIMHQFHSEYVQPFHAHLHQHFYLAMYFERNWRALKILDVDPLNYTPTIEDMFQNIGTGDVATYNINDGSGSDNDSDDTYPTFDNDMDGPQTPPMTPKSNSPSLPKLTLSPERFYY